jgi:hypothetical protein
LISGLAFKATLLQKEERHVMKSARAPIKPWRFFHVYAILATAACLANVAACAPHPGNTVSRPLSGLTEKDPASRRLTPEELQHELFQFVDRYRERVGQATDAGVHRATTADGRIMFQATKTSYVSAAVSVVTGPRPIDALLDLLVMVTLQRMVWESGADGQIPPAEAKPVAVALRRLERQIYDLAARVLPSDVIAKVRDLSTKWRRENPEQHYVAYVRFQNLGASSEADEVNEVISSGGFLAPVETVAREAHEARLLAERTLYLVNRMPMFLEWETTLAYQRIAASPEAAGVLANLSGFRAALERLGEEISRLPDRVADERLALVKDVTQLAARERAQTIDDLRALIRSEREAFFLGLSKGADTYGPILEQLAVTAAATRDAVAALERMTASSEGRADEGVDIKQVHEIAGRLATAATATNNAVFGLNSLFTAELSGLASVNAMLASQVQSLFCYGAALVLLLGIVLYAVLRVSRRQR